MNRKNLFCISLILVMILCFASVAGADYNPYQSTCNPYANAGYYNSYAPGSTRQSYTGNQGIVDCTTTNGTTRNNSYAGNYDSNAQSNACYQPSTNSYYAKGSTGATGNSSTSCYTSGYGSRWTSNNTYCPPRSTPSTPDQNTSQGQDDGYYTPGTLTSQESILVDMINYERANRGLNTLSVDQTLVSLARQKSQDMIQNGYFAHESPTYGSASEMLKDAGYEFKGVGENIAKSASAEKAHAALMSSEGHKKNILGSQWTTMGVGIVNDFNGYPYITELFVR